MDLKQIRDLIQLMKDHDLTEIDLRDGEQQISLKRGGVSGAPVVTTVTPVGTPPVMQAPVVAAPSESPPAGSPVDEELTPITSPMVGTYYNRPDPESEPFVQVGDTIHEDTTVCIIEAMKVFNEIKAEVAGTVERILLENESPVEYGQPLLLVRPAS